MKRTTNWLSYDRKMRLSKLGWKGQLLVEGRGLSQTRTNGSSTLNRSAGPRLQLAG